MLIQGVFSGVALWELFPDFFGTSKRNFNRRARQGSGGFRPAICCCVFSGLCFVVWFYSCSVCNN
jgi:hypothetical protein